MSLEQKYEGKILAVRLYKSDQKEFFVNDFTSIDLLEPILDEIFVGESDITPAGKTFLQEFYGLQELAEILFKRGHIKEIYPSYDNPVEIQNALENMSPMEVLTFIEKARGNINNEGELREDLLPPK